MNSVRMRTASAPTLKHAGSVTKESIEAYGSLLDPFCMPFVFCLFPLACLDQDRRLDGMMMKDEWDLGIL